MVLPPAPPAPQPVGAWPSPQTLARVPDPVAVADQERRNRPTGSKTPTAQELDARRLTFAGDAQFLPQSCPHSGTQGTWDDSVLSTADRPSGAVRQPAWVAQVMASYYAT